MPYFATPSLHIIDLPADAAHSGPERPVSSIKGIVVHSTEGYNSGPWLSSTSNPPVSIHRLLGRSPGQHVKILPDTRVAWHAGSGKWGNYDINLVTLGVELERGGPQGYTEWQMSELASLIMEWWSLYGAIPIMGHGQLDPWRRSDPVRFDWPNLWQRIFRPLQKDRPL